jgi:hypothetical protein
MARNPSPIVLSLGGQGWIRGKRFIGKVTCGLVEDAIKLPRRIHHTFCDPSSFIIVMVTI